MDIQEHDVGTHRRDHGDGLLHRSGLAGHDDVRVQVGLQAGPEDGVVVHDHHPDPRRRAAPLRCWSQSCLSVAVTGGSAGCSRPAGRGSLSRTSVPSGLLVMVAVPPWRFIRPMIDSRTPSRSAGTASGSKPGPRSLTKTSARAVGDFQVDGHGAAAVPGGVQHGLAGGLDQGLVAFGHGAVAHADHLDGVAQGVFHLGRGGLDALGELAGVLARVPVQPAPQLALLGAGQPDDVVSRCRRAAGSGPGSAGRSRAGGRRSRPVRWRGPGRRARSPGRARTSAPRAGGPAPRRRAPPPRPAAPARSVPRTRSRTPSPARRPPRAPARPRDGPSRRPGPPWSCPRGRPGGSHPAASRRWRRRPGWPRPG